VGWLELGNMSELLLIFLSICGKRTMGLVFCAQRFFLREEFCFTFAKP
jgi:hypothetical protein